MDQTGRIGKDSVGEQMKQCLKGQHYLFPLWRPYPNSWGRSSLHPQLWSMVHYFEPKLRLRLLLNAPTQVAIDISMPSVESILVALMPR